MRPLLWKELRENVRWLPVGLIVVSIACWIAVPDLKNSSGLLASVLLTQFAIVAPLLAFALGVVQAYRDLQAGPAAYLNHRGVTASQIFLAKTIAGFALYATSVLVPILVLAGWVWSQGMSWYPMRPAQVIPSLVFGLAAFVMHPAATLMMSRGVSWWGTRLLPLVPAGAILFVFFPLLESGGLWWAGTCLMLIMPMLAWTIAISRQSWRELAPEPPATRTNPRLRGPWLLPTYLLIGASIGCLAFLFFIGFLASEYGQSQVYTPQPSQQLAMNTATDEPWLVTYLNVFDATKSRYDEKPLGGKAIANHAVVDAMEKLSDPDQLKRFSGFFSTLEGHNSNDGFFTRPNAIEGTNLLGSFDERGYILCYQSYPEMRCVSTIAKDGVYPPEKLTGVPFASDPTRGFLSLFREAGYTQALIDSEGMYLLATSPLSIVQLIDQPNEAAALVSGEQGHAPRLLLRSGSDVFEYKFLDATGSDTWYTELETTDEYFDPRSLKQLADIPLSATLVNTYTLPQTLATSDILQVGLSSNTLYLAKNKSKYRELYRIPAKGDYERIIYEVKPLPMQDSDIDRIRGSFVFLGLLPGFLGVVVAGLATWVTMFDGDFGPTWDSLLSYPIQFTTLAVSFAFVTMLAIWLTRRVACRRSLSRGQTLAWCVSVLMLGLIAPLSIVAIYRRVHRTECSHCGKQRRVDTEVCEYCGEPWQRPVHDGILILDDAA